MKVFCHGCSEIKDSEKFITSNRTTTGFRKFCMDCESDDITEAVCKNCNTTFPRMKHSAKKYCCTDCRNEALRKQKPKNYKTTNAAVLENKSRKIDRLVHCFRGKVRCTYYENWMTNMWCECVGFKE